MLGSEIILVVLCFISLQPSSIHERQIYKIVMKPYFSIVIPLFNKERHIKATIESVLAQSFQDFEIIVVNDGSTDGSFNVVQSITDVRLKVLSIENQGVSHARNYGTKHAKSDFICFLDADDFWHHNHLDDIKLMQSTYPDCGMFCKTYDKKRNKRLHKCHYNTVIIDNSIAILDDYFKATLVDSIANSSSIMIPKKTYDSIGGFDESIDSGEDTDMWIRIALHHPVCFYNKLSVTINQDAENRISQKHILQRRIMDLDKFETYASENKWLKQYLDLNRFSLGMQSKLDGEHRKANNYFNKIDSHHLSSKQKLLMTSPRFVLILLKNTQHLLKWFNIDLSSYR